MSLLSRTNTISRGGRGRPSFVGTQKTVAVGAAFESGAAAAIAVAVHGAPVWSQPPVFNINEGTVYSNLPLYVTATGGASISLAWVGPGSKPAWVTLHNGVSPSISFSGQVDANDLTGVVISATANAKTTNSPAGSITVGAAGEGTLSTTFTLSATTSQTNAPFTFAHAFKQGDVPAGTVALASGATDFQCRVLTTWPDGSAKHAIIAGRANVINGDATLTLSAGADPGGADLTDANLSAAMPTVTIAAGAFTWTLNSSIGTADRHRTVCTGPVMSNWIYRKPVTGSNHLVLWADVRFYKGGNVEIFPWVENAYLTVESPTNDVRTYTVTISGSQRFSQSIDVKHHTRVPLLSGSAFSYWTGTDPGITPKHDRAYLMSTKLVPSYGYTSPSAATLNALPQTYTPNTLAGISTAMGAAGSSAAIINNSQAFYVTSGGDARAYRAAVVFGLSGGSWSTHYRDEATSEPIKFSSYPGASLNVGSNITIPSGEGGTNGTPVTTHQPSFGYLPYLITGRWFFFEESAFWTTYNYLAVRPNSRRGETNYETAPFMFANGAAGVINPSDGMYANRGAHWSIRLLAQTLAICQTTHSLFNDLKTAFESNASYYRQKYVDGTFASGWVSPQGFLGDYSADGSSVYGQPGGVNAWFGAGWMSAFGAQAWGYASELGLPLSAQAQSDHLAVRNHAYKQVVERAGDGSSYNWRRFAVYAYPIGADATGLPPDSWYTPAQSYSALRTAYSLADIPATSGLSLKQHSSDTDMGASDSTATDYFPFALSALAYAVDHGATGAAAGWLRITGASNFATVSAGWNNNPGHGIAPRTSVGMPSWLQGQAVNEWREITGTKLSDQPTMAAPNGSGGTQGKQDAWNGWHADQRTNRVYSVGQGGHDDYWGNEVNAIDLSANTPAWSQLVAATVSANVTSADDYYADGKPASTHGYYTAVFVESLNRAVRFPGGSKSKIGFATSIMSAFNVQTGAYDAASVWSGLSAPAGIGTGPNAYAKHPTTEAVYALNGNSNLSKWTPGLPGSWSTLINFPSTSPNYTAAACDPTRGTGGQVFFLGGNNTCLRYDIGTNALATITLTGTDIKSSAGIGLVYVAATDKYYACIPSAGGSSVYVITPNSTTSWACSLLSTAGGASLPNTASNSAYFPYTKFLYLPNLGGCVFGPRWGSNLWFLRLH